MRFKVGDIAWLRDTGAGWIQVKIIRIIGNYYITKRLDKQVIIGASSHRLKTEEEYKKCYFKPAYLSPPDLH